MIYCFINVLLEWSQWLNKQRCSYQDSRQEEDSVAEYDRLAEKGDWDHENGASRALGCGERCICYTEEDFCSSWALTRIVWQDRVGRTSNWRQGTILLQAACWRTPVLS